MKIKSLTNLKLHLSRLFALLILTVVALAICPSKAEAQTPYEIHGYVVDSFSGQVLKNATITSKGEIVARTNSLGYYTVSVSPYEGEYTFEHSSYLGVIHKFYITDDTAINIALIPLQKNFEQFQELTANRSRLDEVEPGKVVAPVNMLERLPQLGDEPDLFRSLQKLPGVDFGNEINAVLNVRGGSNDQNLILYNHIPVYKSTQLFNTLSFQIAPVDEVTVYRGTNPARFGGRLSSVVDITSLDGIAKKASAEFGLSLTSARFKLNTPIKPNKSSLSLSARRSYIDLLFPSLFFEGDNAFNFYDINLKFNRELKGNARMSIFSLFTKDNLLLNTDITDSLGTTSYKQGVFTYNLVSGIKFQKRFRKNLFGELSGAYTGNALRLLFTEQNLGQPAGFPVLAETHFNFGNYDIIVNGDLYANLNNKHQLNFGTNLISHSYATGILVERNEDNLGNELESETTGEGDPERTIEVALYGEDEWTYSDKMRVNAGLRTVFYSHENYSKFFIEPRLRFRYSTSDDGAFKFGYSRNNQFSHFISYASGNFFSARWVPATEKAPAQNSDLITAGYTHHLKSNLIVEAEAYYKRMNNILISEDGFLGDVLNWENLVIPGSGRAYGLELFTYGRKEHFSFMASYALSWAQRKYEGINNDEFFNYDFDRRHMLKANMIYTRGNDDQIAFNYAVGSGRPFSVPNSKYRDIDGRIILGYDEINNYRSTFYHRLDVSYSRYMFRNSTVENFLKFTIYNALMNQNASQLFVELNKNVVSGIVYNVNTVSYLVIIPSISYNLRF